MIFQELNKLKRSTIMSSIILIVIGILMFLCPERYIRTMIGLMGAILLIFSIIGILEYLSSNKSLIHYVYLTGWMILGIVGFAVLVFEINSLFAIGWLFGVFLILSGIGNIVSAFMYAKPSGRQSWWILVLLALVLVACGVIILVNPWWDSYSKLFKVIGIMMLFSSVVGILRLICIWPIKSE